MWSFSRPAIVLLAALGWASPGLADPSAADVESAKQQYLEGMNLRQQGDEAGALTRFKAAYALVPTPITALEVGRSELALGKILDAREILLKAAHMPKTPGESAKADDARAEADKLADGAKGRLASLSVAPVEGDATVVVDGVTIPKDAASVPRVVDPGHHVVEVHAPAGDGKVELDVTEGESKSVTVPLGPRVIPPSPTRIHPLVFVGFGVGAVGLLVGAGTGVGALVTAGALRDECPNKVCAPSSQSTLDASKALGTTSTIAFIAGGAFVAVGVVGLLLSHFGKTEAPKAARVVPLLGFGTVGLEGSF